MIPESLSPDVIIADDHPITRMGIRFILKSYFPMARLREVCNGKQALQLCEQCPANVLLLDLNMPDTDPFATVTQLLQLQPSLNILIFTIAKEEIFGPLYFKAGVKGFLSKLNEEKEIVRAIETVLTGKRYISAGMLEFYEQKSNPYDPYELLTPKEKEALRYFTNNMRQADICKAMNINITTVSTYKASILGKLRLDNLLELKSLVEHYAL